MPPNPCAASSPASHTRAVSPAPAPSRRLVRQPGRGLARGRRVREVAGERHRARHGPGRRDGVRVPIRPGHQQPHLPRRLALVRLISFLREAIRAEEEAHDERLHGLGGPAEQRGGDQRPPGRHAAAHGRARLPHRGRGPVTEPEEQERARAARTDHRAAEVAGIAGRLAAGDHVGRGRAQVRIDSG